MAYVSVPRSARRVRSGGFAYVSRPALRQRAKGETVAWWDEYNFDAPTHLSVYECDTHPEPTGLLDEHGNELVRCYERRPIGFQVGTDNGWQE